MGETVENIVFQGDLKGDKNTFCVPREYLP